MYMCPVYRRRFDELFTDVQYWGVLCDVQVGYGLGVNTVLVSGCFGAQWSVAHDLWRTLKAGVMTVEINLPTQELITF